ncbi:MAG: non-homologous end-joining DNA ligase [Candidatus Baltobacteraceae bacterium]
METHAEIRVDARTLKLSNLTKIYFPHDRITKGDLLAYYDAVAEHFLAHARRRPLTLERAPDGIGGARFIEKQIPRGTPPWVHRVALNALEGTKRVTYALCDDRATLLYFVNLGTIAFHGWVSHTGSLSSPDFAFFDLDPGEECSMATLSRVALTVRDHLQRIGLSTLVKTSGATGLHVLAPLSGPRSYGNVKTLTYEIARSVLAERPTDVTIERSLRERDRRAVYLDYRQVGRGKTIALPYSVRLREGAPVSTPLHWHEVEEFAAMRLRGRPFVTLARYNIASVRARIAHYGDLWKDFERDAREIAPALAALPPLGATSAGKGIIGRS